MQQPLALAISGGLSEQVLDFSEQMGAQVGRGQQAREALVIFSGGDRSAGPMKDLNFLHFPVLFC